MIQNLNFATGLQIPTEPGNVVLLSEAIYLQQNNTAARILGGYPVLDVPELLLFVRTQ